MAETSNGRVTITLGRSGQVVKRAATIPDGYSRPPPAVGSKRSVRDRLGGNLDSITMQGSQYSSKRQRGDSSLTSLGGNGVKDVRIGKDDLRFKLQQKNVSRRDQSDDNRKGMDLRDKLSRTMRPLGPSVNNFDAQQRMPPPRDTSILGRIPPTRSADDLPRLESSRNSHSAWTLDHIRRRSPDRVVGTSRGLSPLRNVEQLQRRQLGRTVDDVRAVPYMNKDVHDTPRSVSSSTPFMAKPVLPPVSSKPVAPIIGQLPPPSGIMQKSSFVGEEQQTVEGLLHSLGLGKYAILFKAEEVDMTALKQMGESDLKELGIPMGPRKKILLAILPRSKRQQSQI